MRQLKQANGWWATPTGPNNSITDVKGVSVGHFTHDSGLAHTGVTAILPHAGNLFDHKVVAGGAILNGFGKSTGLMQMIELGQIETPILLTNTFAVPACAQTLIEQALAQNPDIGRAAATVNPLVLECNDGRVNDIRSLAITADMARQAITAASPKPVAQGSIGAGRGMQTFGLAGGIGSASRVLKLPSAQQFTLGALVLSNFGQASEFRFMGQRLAVPQDSQTDKGSIIVILATDAPLDARQLGRLARRAGPALGRLGSYMGHGSGDVALAFSSANLLSEQSAPIERLREDWLDFFFLAAVEAIEESVLNALWQAQPVTGYDGKTAPILRDLVHG